MEERTKWQYPKLSNFRTYSGVLSNRLTWVEKICTLKLKSINSKILEHPIIYLIKILIDNNRRGINVIVPVNTLINIMWSYLSLISHVYFTFLLTSVFSLNLASTGMTVNGVKFWYIYIYIYFFYIIMLFDNAKARLKNANWAAHLWPWDHLSIQNSYGCRVAWFRPFK